MNILISACLYGQKCRYDGNGEMNAMVMDCSNKHTFVPVCPEILGGMNTPRNPCEIVEGKVKTAEGEDYTSFFVEGALKTLQVAMDKKCQYAILKDKSPSCGFGKIYDGTFSRKLIDGNGITANLLASKGIKVIPSSELEEFLGAL